MRYAYFDINLINIHDHNMHVICIFVFLLVLNNAWTFLFAMINNLPRFTTSLTFMRVIDIRLTFSTQKILKVGWVNMG